MINNGRNGINNSVWWNNTISDISFKQFSSRIYSKKLYNNKKKKELEEKYERWEYLSERAD